MLSQISGWAFPVFLVGSFVSLALKCQSFSGFSPWPPCLLAPIVHLLREFLPWTPGLKHRVILCHCILFLFSTRTIWKSYLLMCLHVYCLSPEDPPLDYNFSDQQICIFSAFPPVLTVNDQFVEWVDSAHSSWTISLFQALHTTFMIMTSPNKTDLTLSRALWTHDNLLGDVGVSLGYIIITSNSTYSGLT